MSDRCTKFYVEHIGKYISTINNFKDILSEDSVIFDIGSNIGLFSLALCSAIKINKIYLFEPVKEYFNYSKILLKNYNNVYYENIGLSNEETTTFIYKNKGDNIGWNSIYLNDPCQRKGMLPINNMDKEEIQLTTFTNYCNLNNITKVDFIKIDVEGLEYKVIEGLLDFLRETDKKPYLYIEVGWGTKHPEWNKAVIIYEELFTLGYKKVIFSDKTEDILFEPVIQM